MITLLSPSKKLNFNEQNIVHSHTECDFIKSAEILANEAKNLTENDLKDLMSISDNLAKLNRKDLIGGLCLSILQMQSRLF